MLSGALFKNIAVKLEQSGVFAFDVIVKKSPCLIARLRRLFRSRCLKIIPLLDKAQQGLLGSAMVAKTD